VSARLEGSQRLARALRAEQGQLSRTLARLPSLTADDVHATRVHCRRLRSWLKTFGPYFDPDLHREYRQALRVVADVLGDLRQLDVMVAMRPLREPVIAAVLTRERSAAAVQVRRRSRSVAVCAALATVESYPDAAGLGLQGDVTDADLLRAVARASRHALGKVSRASSLADLHELRLSLKHCRYAIEFAKEIEGKETAALGRRLRAAQQALGDHRDTIMAQSWLAAHEVETGPAGQTARRRLARQQRLQLAEARAAVDALAPARKRWREAVRTLTA
jgi:CHAD domain-containing protein